MVCLFVIAVCSCVCNVPWYVCLSLLYVHVFVTFLGMSLCHCYMFMCLLRSLLCLYVLAVCSCVCNVPWYVFMSLLYVNVFVTFLVMSLCQCCMCMYWNIPCREYVCLWFNFVFACVIYVTYCVLTCITFLVVFACVLHSLSCLHVRQRVLLFLHAIDLPRFVNMFVDI